MELIELRYLLHKKAELSGMEDSTSKVIEETLTGYEPDRLIANLGGKGVAAEFKGTDSGPRILLRCEMDALPIDEKTDIPHRSITGGVSHKCGHDGHMAILMGVAARLHNNPPARGSVVLLFQPSEETGEGAQQVIYDSKFKDIEPDVVFALHNLPGFPTGSIITKNGVFASASSGIIVKLTGTSSHASEPHLGRSPALAIAQLIESFSSLPQSSSSMSDATKVTVIYARIGKKTFGISPGEGTIMATLRTHTANAMNTLSIRAEKMAEATALAYNLDCGISWTETFPVTNNSDKAVSTVRAAAVNLNLESLFPDTPFPWSEDFGHFTKKYPGALFGIGAGKGAPALHSQSYDFPDELLAVGVNIFTEIVNILLN